MGANPSVEDLFGEMEGGAGIQVRTCISPCVYCLLEFGKSLGLNFTDFLSQVHFTDYYKSQYFLKLGSLFIMPAYLLCLL